MNPKDEAINALAAIVIERDAEIKALREALELQAKIERFRVQRSQRQMDLRWRPISELTENHDQVVLLRLDQDFEMLVSGLLWRNYDASAGWTHFFEIPDCPDLPEELQ